MVCLKETLQTQSSSTPVVLTSEHIAQPIKERLASHVTAVSDMLRDCSGDLLCLSVLYPAAPWVSNILSGCTSQFQKFKVALNLLYRKKKKIILLLLHANVIFIEESKARTSQLINTKQPSDSSLPYTFCSTNPSPLTLCIQLLTLLFVQYCSHL